MSDLVAFLRARLDDDAGDNQEVHDLDCNLSLSAGFHGPCDCGWPDRMRREVEAKRLRLAEIERELADDPTNETARWLLSVEALPYDSHPDYRTEWAVTP